MNLPAKDNGQKWRRLASHIAIVAMLTGLLFSRALLSSAIILFAIVSLIHGNILQQVRTFFTLPFLWSMSLLFLLPAISGFWSDDRAQWLQILRIKLPLILLPLCFSREDSFKSRDWQRVAFAFLLLILAGVCWSLLQYLRDIRVVHAAYLKAYTFQTPVGNDHVRFSLLVAIAIFTIVFLLVKDGRNFKRVTRISLLSLGVVNVIYLHVLAVRTGLICFYLGVFALLIWLLYRHKIEKFFLVVLIFLVPVASFFIFPTFKNRISYLKYDLSFVQKNTYLPGSSDGNRLASIKAGWELLRQNPFVGVGFGDVRHETEKFYETNFPQMSENDKILPSSEWMMYGSGAGWLGVILFSFAVLMPFVIRELRKDIFWILINFFIALSYLFDIGLEVQYGVFMHGFILLWWYKWLQLRE